jgi:hypothetical protein
MWCKHRITAGIRGKIEPWLTVDLYYRWDVVDSQATCGAGSTTRIFGVKLVLDSDHWTDG